MKLVEMEIAALNEAEYNPRVKMEIGTADFERLKNSIEKFDCVEPVVWNARTQKVIGGAQRLAILKHLGRQKVMVSVVDLDPEQEKLLNIALNKVKGAWDIGKLERLVREIDYNDLSFTGFGADELSLMLGGDEEISDETIEEDFDEVPMHDVSWCITLKFSTMEKAKIFAEQEGWDINLKSGSNSFVYRIEG